MKRTRRNLKKPQPIPNLILEESIGLTTKSGNGLSSSTSSTKCAYIAGCVVVLYDVDAGSQSHFLAPPNRMPKPLSCVALSQDGTVLAAGESGHQPAILVWDCITLAFICELKGHQYGVRCLSLSPDGKHLVSVGSPRDGCLCLWDWRDKILVTKVKASSPSFPVACIKFSLKENLFVTVGKNNFKIWKIRSSSRSRSSTRPIVSVTMEKVINLDHKKEWSFVAVTTLSSTSSTFGNDIKGGELVTFYAVTEKGTLCMVCPGSLVNFVELEVEKCFAVSASNTLVACACNDGVVELFTSGSLKHASRLCYADAKRSSESDVLDCKTGRSQFENQTRDRLPDAIACQFSTLKKLVVVYDDHSLYIWNIEDTQKATRCCVLVSHSECIWDIKNVPCHNMHDPSLSCVARGCSGGLSFATCSADGTIRLWDLALGSTLSADESSVPMEESSSGAMHLVSAGIFERESVAINSSSHDFRSMAISSDGKHLAAGDACGNIHIYNLYTSEYICIQDAHGAEILSLSFNFTNKVPTDSIERHCILASGGRDGVIHLFDVERNFDLVGKINCGSSAFAVANVGQNDSAILSFADTFLVLHGLDLKETECNISTLSRIATHGSIKDLVVDHSLKIALTVGQNKEIDVHDIQSGKLVNSFKHDADAGEPIKVITDGSCSYLACSYSNRYICVYDYISGQMVARATGHSDVVTSMAFLSDCRRLVSVGADGCIFVWKLPVHLCSRMLQRIQEVPCDFMPELVNVPVTLKQLKASELVDHPEEGYCDESSGRENWIQTIDKMVHSKCSCPETPGLKFSISRLPNWAQSKVATSSLSMNTDPSPYKVASNNYACLESQSLTKDILKIDEHASGKLSSCLSETNSSPGSQGLPKDYSWTNHRWMTTYTLCMDSTDSPRTCEVKGLKLLGSSMNERLGSHATEKSYSCKRIKLLSLDPKTTNASASHNFSIDKHDESDEDPLCKYVDALKKASQEDDIFRCHTGNLPALTSTHTEKSLTMSKSRFLVRRELLEGRKMSFGVQGCDSGATLRKKQDTSSSSIQQILPTSMLEELGNASGILRQTRDLTRFSPAEVHGSRNDAEKSINATATNNGDQETCDVAEDELETVRLCDEALSNLETVAENALQLFSQLSKLDIREKKSRSFTEVRLSAERFSFLKKKIHAIGKLLQSNNNFE